MMADLLAKLFTSLENKQFLLKSHYWVCFLLFPSHLKWPTYHLENNVKTTFKLLYIHKCIKTTFILSHTLFSVHSYFQLTRILTFHYLIKKQNISCYTLCRICGWYLLHLLYYVKIKIHVCECVHVCMCVCF